MDLNLPWAADPDQLVAELQSDTTDGLSSREADDRLIRSGPNSLAPAEPVPAWRKVVAQFTDPVVYLLLVAIVVSVTAWSIEGEEAVPIDAIVITAIVVANAALGLLQERRADAAIEALRTLTRSETTVVRDGRHRRVDTADLVVGDVIVLTDGDLVGADARVVQASGLQIAEAALTGESAAVLKSPQPIDADAALGDRTAMVYSGTAVVAGHGLAVVTSVGTATEVGRIATLLGRTESEATPLSLEIDRVGRTLGLAVVVIAAAVIAALVLVDDERTTASLIEALLIGVSLAVAAVPEGLPAVLTVVLALGVQRMSGRRALVKRLASVETLGSATVICSDKTGTLTRNEMSVRKVVLATEVVDVTDDGLTLPASGVAGSTSVAALRADADWALLIGRLASDASLDGGATRRAAGDPTEAAVIAAQTSGGGQDPADRYHRIAELPFTPERKRMSAVMADRRHPEQHLLVAKGAPDELLDHCDAERRDGQLVQLTPERRQRWRDETELLAGAAFRTLAIAYRELGAGEPLPDNGEPAPDGALEDDLVLLAVVGIIDPPRDEARLAVEQAIGAGIRVAMITGDHPETARRIARDLGIIDDDGRVATSAEIDSCDEAGLRQLVTTTSVYARVTPEQKLRIVLALRSHGEIVAMTGDGVNDAPALKAADIGVAMGITGTEVSKEASDMILADDNFATIVAAVSEGRAIFHNIRSFLRYLLSSNIGEVLTVFGGVLGASVIGLTGDAVAAEGAGPISPLLAVQILWINLVTDAGPALALGVDPPSEGLMQRRPRRTTDRVIDRRMQSGILLVGATMALAALIMLDLRLPGGLVSVDPGDVTTARTGAFTVLVLAQLFNTFNARSDTESFVHRATANRWLLWAVALSLLLQVAVVHLGPLNRAFGTSPLSVTDWVVAFGLASSVLWVAEARKFVLRRRTPADQQD